MIKKTLILFVFALAGCASVSTSYDYDKTADFTKFKTYTFADHANTVGGLEQLDRSRVLAAIDKEMTKRGYTKSDNADLLVDIHVKAEEGESATATTYGNGPYGRWGYGWGGGFTTTNVDINKFTEGTLFVNVIDKGTEKIVWQGRGTKTIDENISPEKKESNINAAVAAIYKHYPVPAK